MRRGRLHQLASAAVALALVASACGGDDDSADEPAEGTADETAEEPAEETAEETEEPAEETAEESAEETAEESAEETAEESAEETAEESAEESTPPMEERTIQVGFAWPDLSAFEQVSPAYGVGEQEQQLLAVLEAWRADGTLPVNGIDIEPVFQSFDALDPETKLAACQVFGTEGEIFAVLGARIFTEGAECLATRFQIPVIDTDQAARATIEGAAPYMYTLKPDRVEAVEVFVNWALERGSFEGKSIGLFWESQESEAVDVLKSMLSDAGIELVSEVESGGQGSVAGEQDALAAQRFAADGVDLAIFMVGSTSITNFLQAAADQGYTPEYLDFDWASHMSDVAAGAYNAEQWAGTEAISATTIGDMPDLAPQAEECLSNYESFSGSQIERNPPEVSGEFSNILLVCDLAAIMLEALTAATADGGELTQDAFIAGIQGIEGLPGSWVETITFGADDPTAAAVVREVVYDVDCPCWRPTSDWMDVDQFLE